MKNNYSVKRINSPFDDTAFFVRNIHKKEPFLLDCGRLGDITNGELLDIRDIFISHTHIDHFYGFDRVIRGLLRSENPVRVYGPPGFIKNVHGKLSGYTWNLIKSYPLTIEVYEIGHNEIKKVIFSARNGFEPYTEQFTEDKIRIGDGFEVEYCFFDHKTPSLGYRIKEPVFININKEKLHAAGLKSGKWLSVLKDKLYKCENKGEIYVEEENRYYEIESIAPTIVEYSMPQDLTFITDIAPTYENFSKAVAFARNSYMLMIEAMFMKSDFIHSIDKGHLSIPLAREIFNLSKSSKVLFFHFAPKYERVKSNFYEELKCEIEEKII
jgi:ribonuclease Z